MFVRGHGGAQWGSCGTCGAMGRLVGYGVFNGVTVGLVGLWGARVGSQGAWEGHGVLVWGHGGAHRGSCGTCGAMGRLVELCDAHVMSWGAWWGHRVLIWGHGVLLLPVGCSVGA